jgi:putative tributyrin esterase
LSIATVQFMSQTLWRQVTYTALLPDENVVGPGPYPVLYQLHGGNQNHTAWLYGSNLARYVQELPLIVILPDGAQSRWANGGPPFEHYEDFLIDELARHVRQTFHATSGKWAIGGNSMGGFGAVRLGLKYPDRFCSIWSHSGCFPKADSLAEHWYWSGDADDLDCYALVDSLDLKMMPRLSFDCGADDHLLDQNRRYHAFLNEQGIPHAYHEHAGGHTWDYWDAHIQEALKQHFDELRLGQLKTSTRFAANGKDI